MLINLILTNNKLVNTLHLQYNLIHHITRNYNSSSLDHFNSSKHNSLIFRLYHSYEL